MNTIKYLKEKKYKGTNEDISKIREDFKSYGIKVSYSAEEKNRRIIFSSVKQYRQSSAYDVYLSECNGLILKSITWEPLVIPPRTFKSNIKVDIVNDGISRDEYDIFKVQDGTMINLYYFDDNWKISTAKGYDVSYLKWNDKVYEQIFKEVLLNQGFDIGEFYNSLEKSKCYTFCFTHPDFHPFWQNKSPKDFMNLTFIQYVNIKSHEVFYDNPFDEKKINMQPKGEKINNVKDLFRKLPTALNDYKEKGEIDFGYILRFKKSVKLSSENVIFSHIFLESRLLQTIRKFIYSGHFNKFAHEKKFDKNKFILVNAFLDKKMNSTFIDLFPQYKFQFEKLELISAKLVKKIMVLHNNPKLSEDEDILTKSSQYLLNNINKIYTLNFKTRDVVRKITSFIVNPVYVEIFYNLFEI